MEYRKESAIFGILGALMFLIGYTLLPNLKILNMINPFQIFGFIFVIVSLAMPWYGKLAKTFKL